MTNSNQTSTTARLQRASLRDAAEAFRRGDVDECIVACAALPPTPDVAVLSARALIRAGRFDEVALVLATLLRRSDDIGATARALLGAAQTRAGDMVGALHDLNRIDIAAIGETARAEVALARCLALWMLRRLDEALAALDDVRTVGDVHAARALEYRGWIYVSQNAYHEALQSFRAALAAYSAAGSPDVFAEAQVLYGIAIFGAELIDRSTIAEADAAYRRFPWSPSLSVTRFQVAIYRARAAEVVHGLRTCAARLSEAIAIAPTAAYRAQALAERAMLYAHQAEEIGAEDAFREAQELIGDVRLLDGEERFGALAVAEAAIAVEQRAIAVDILGAYGAPRRPSNALSLEGDVRLAAYVSYLHGLVESRSDLLRDAFTAFSQIGYARRAAIAAWALVRHTGDDAAARYARGVALTGDDEWWLTQTVAPEHRMATSEVHLTERERAVLRQILAGHDYASIAKSLDLSYGRIRNVSTELMRKFKVADRSSLVVQCVERGYMFRGRNHSFRLRRKPPAA